MGGRFADAVGSLSSSSRKDTASPNSFLSMESDRARSEAGDWDSIVALSFLSECEPSQRLAWERNAIVSLEAFIPLAAV